MDLKILKDQEALDKLLHIRSVSIQWKALCEECKTEKKLCSLAMQAISTFNFAECQNIKTLSEMTEVLIIVFRASSRNDCPPIAQWYCGDQFSAIAHNTHMSLIHWFEGRNWLKVYESSVVSRKLAEKWLTYALCCKDPKIFPSYPTKTLRALSIRLLGALVTNTSSSDDCKRSIFLYQRKVRSRISDLISLNGKRVEVVEILLKAPLKVFMTLCPDHNASIINDVAVMRIRPRMTDIVLMRFLGIEKEEWAGTTDAWDALASKFVTAQFIPPWFIRLFETSFDGTPMPPTLVRCEKYGSSLPGTAKPI